MKVCLTGGIACGKSLLSRYLNELGVETLDADDIVHNIIPADERRRLASVVFKDPKARRELEEKIHPIVRARINQFFSENSNNLRIAIIPLLFEVHWEEDFDIIVCISSDQSKQIERMISLRGYTRDEAISRLAAQIPVSEKVQKSHYVIQNNASSNELKREAIHFVEWLKEKVKL